MKYFLAFICFVQIYCVACSVQKRQETSSLQEAIAKAQGQLRTFYIDKLWQVISDVQTNSSYDLLKLYSEGTMLQAQHVVEYIVTYSNNTKNECEDLRRLTKYNNTKNYPALDCVNNYEKNLLRAFKQTGYHLHNCIREAQITSENATSSILAQLEGMKITSMKNLHYYLTELSNCLDDTCVFRVLMTGIRNYDEIDINLRLKITELQSATTRYLMSYVAMGCVAGSINQIFENYNIGITLIRNCTSPVITTADSG